MSRISGVIMPAAYSTQHQLRVGCSPVDRPDRRPKKWMKLPAVSKANVYASSPMDTSSAVNLPSASKVGVATVSSCAVVIPFLSW